MLGLKWLCKVLSEYVGFKMSMLGLKWVCWAVSKPGFKWVCWVLSEYVEF